MQEVSSLEHTHMSRPYEEGEVVLQAHATKMMYMYISLHTQSKFAIVRAAWYSFLDTQNCLVR